MAERVGLLVAPLLAPSGPPYRALSPLRRCRHRLIHAAKNLPINWRRGWDSNPRTRLGVTHFPGVRLRPLGHLSTRAARVPEPAHAIKSDSRAIHFGGEGGIAAAPSWAAALRADAARRPKSLPAILSNPRTRLGVTHFPGVRLRPIGHLSTRVARVPELTQPIKSSIPSADPDSPSTSVP
jgi:hypothetical protein